MIEKIKYCAANVTQFVHKGANSIYELLLMALEKLDEVVDKVNGFETELDAKEDSANITNSRKLSNDGDFNGTICGKRKTACQIAQELDDNRQQIVYLGSQFADGQTGLVVDGGFFEESGIRKNYNGGIF